MTAYVIAQGLIKDKQLYEEYVDRLIPILHNYNAKILSVDDNPLIMDGDIECNKAVIIEFESKEMAMKLYNSLEYQEILPIRQKAMPAIFTIAEGVNL